MKFFKTLVEAYEVFGSIFHSKKRPNKLSISYGSEELGYDTLEEFLAEYPKAKSFVFIYRDRVKDDLYEFNVFGYENHVSVQVENPTRAGIESVFQVFERDLDKSKIEKVEKVEKVESESEPIKIFVGHGHSEQWRDLRDHLREKHGFDVIAYEIAPRAGKSIKEVLESMLSKSSIAFLILTGEDIDDMDELHARENVTHELGLFQGRLGFERAIPLVEEGVKEFSNISGINQIRFTKGNIRETFGDVLATIKREFGEE